MKNLLPRRLSLLRLLSPPAILLFPLVRLCVCGVSQTFFIRPPGGSALFDRRDPHHQLRRSRVVEREHVSCVLQQNWKMG